MLTGLARKVRDWSPGEVRELFITNLARGGLRDKTAVAKTALGRRSQAPPFIKLEVLGVGMFGTVVSVHHKHFGGEYALKTVAEVSRMPSRLICVLVSISGTGGQETEANKNNGGFRVERGALSPGRVFFLTRDEAADACVSKSRSLCGVRQIFVAL